VQQQESKALVDDHVALLPEDLAKQVASCQAVQRSLRTYQGELASLWAQGRELERDATDKERVETLARLEELQVVFETVQQRTAQRLTELDKAMTSRKYFQIDLDKTCAWLRRADAVTFPEVNLTDAWENSDLHARLSCYQRVLEQASEYENLLLIVQRIGQEILPTLNEVDHCYLDERLNALPQQYNSILALAKEKRDRVRQAILERNEFSTFFDLTRNALEELQVQHDNLEKQTLDVSETGAVRLRGEYGNLNGSLAHLSPAVRELMGKREAFHSRGQWCDVEEIQRSVALHDTLKRQINRKMKLLDDCLEAVVDHNCASANFESKCNEVRESLVRLQSGANLGAMDTLAGVLPLLESVDSLSAQAEERKRKLKGLNLNFDPSAIQEITLWQESLQSLQSEVRECIAESERKLCQNEDFMREMEKVLAWLVATRDKIQEPLTFTEVKVEKAQEEVKRLRMIVEEVEAVLRAAGVLGSRQKQRFVGRKQEVPANVEERLQQLHKLDADVKQAISTKKVLHCLLTGTMITKYFFMYVVLKVLFKV